jgi:hypothetical protein
MSAENAISGNSRHAGPRGLLTARCPAPFASEPGPGAELAAFPAAPAAGLATNSCPAVAVAPVPCGTARNSAAESALACPPYAA